MPNSQKFASLARVNEFNLSGGKPSFHKWNVTNVINNPLVTKLGNQNIIQARMSFVNHTLLRRVNVLKSLHAFKLKQHASDLVIGFFRAWFVPDIHSRLFASIYNVFRNAKYKTINNPYYIIL